jgi:Ssp1 endopeptidase immunity protein Rap1a
MKRYALCGQALALALFYGPAMAAEVYMSADDYMMSSQQERWGFVQGVYDTYGAIARAGHAGDTSRNTNANGLPDCAAKVSVNELEQTFSTWLESNPDRWNEKMPSLFLVAIGEQCAGPKLTQNQDASAN